MPAENRSFTITSLIENPKNAVDISDIYSANLITNHGYHRDAMDMISMPPCISVIEDIDQEEPLVNILIPFEIIPFADGEAIPIDVIFDSMTDADIDHIHVIDNYAIGQEIVLTQSHNTPIDAWFERQNGSLMMIFQYRKSLLDNLFVTNGVIHFMFGSILLSFEKTSDDSIVFTKGAMVELIAP